jgi:hypothetical protein
MNFINKIICYLFGHKILVVEPQEFDSTIDFQKVKTWLDSGMPVIFGVSPDIMEKCVNDRMLYCRRCGTWSIKKGIVRRKKKSA